jgi:hypothetical protein
MLETLAVPHVALEATSVNDGRSEFGKLAAELAKDRWARLSEEERKLEVDRMVEAAKQKRASITPEEKQELIRKQQEGRKAALALRRLRGERTDHMSPETRRHVARLGGLAAAAKKFENLSAGERKELGKNLPEARAARAAKIDALLPAGKPAEERHFMRDRFVGLPRTGTRKGNTIAFIKLINRVDEDPDFVGGAHGWSGKFFKPGQIIPESDLWPDKSYPPRPLLLECAGPCGDREQAYFLYELRQRQWIEIARSQSRRGEWSHDLRPIARRALARQGYPKKTKVDVHKTGDRLLAMIDAALMGMSKTDQAILHDIIHDGNAARSVALMPNAAPAIRLTDGDRCIEVEVIVSPTSTGGRPNNARTQFEVIEVPGDEIHAIAEVKEKT